MAIESQIVVRLFGPQAKLAGADAVVVPVESQRIEVGMLRRRMMQLAPALAVSLPTSRFAVNHEYVSDDDSVAVGDEVALIGMVSGG